MRHLFALACILLPLLSAAQDMVITLKNDTLKGNVKIMTFDRIDRVQVSNGKQKEQFTAIQVKTILIGQDIYHTIRKSDGYQFMKIISGGYLSLYNGRRDNTLIYDAPYLVRRDGEVIEVPNLGFKKVMSNFLSDCMSIRQKIKDENLGPKDLDKIISDYNQCIDQQTAAMHPPESKTLDNPIMVALADLKSKLTTGTADVPQDALDILNDITDKVKNNKPVPNYLIEALNDLLKDHPSCRPELERVTNLLKNP